ncbi:hypothetical protein OSB04_001625 [Centaurea solstitialis]|uniref:Uncharacterized protein n=1 Tax=Centaurea solstitialis TaxID=347529 RepID=A0AA38TT54_9ASTR|nr:hypothetical protein OSB04_001625 [Centaurea solstitialis]
MERRFSTIMDIQPTMKNPWTVLVQVVEPGHMQTSKASSNFRRLLLTDSQGTKTTTVIYAAHLKFFLKTFRAYKRYYISNVVVTKADTRFMAIVVKCFPCEEHEQTLRVITKQDVVVINREYVKIP